jgi:hypothetical protein
MSSKQTAELTDYILICAGLKMDKGKLNTVSFDGVKRENPLYSDERLTSETSIKYIELITLEVV